MMSASACQTLWVLRQAEFAPLHCLPVEIQHAPGQRFADPGDELNGFHGLAGADDTNEGCCNAVLRTVQRFVITLLIDEYINSL